MSTPGSEYDSSANNSPFEFSPSPTPTPKPSSSVSPTPLPPRCQPHTQMPPPTQMLPPNFSQNEAPTLNQASSTPAASSSKRKGRITTSFVWNHFEKLVIDGVQKARCIHCKLLMSGNTKNGTSHLKDHLTVRCPGKHLRAGDIRQKLLGINRKADGGTTLEMKNTNFSQEISRQELSTMVILHEYPLAIVDHIGFRRFVKSLNPNFKIISRNTLRADIMKLFTTEKAALKKELEDNWSRLAITTDMWTASNQKKGYMAVTAHYIDQYWALRNRTLRFVYVPCPHTSETLAQVLIDTLNMYNITEKISSVVVDNCTTNDAMMDCLKSKLDMKYIMLSGSFLHMRCSAHILNLIVQDGLDVIGGGIERIRDCVSFWTATPKRMETFENKVKSLKLDCSRKLSLDCRTRWNSTFLMLQSAFPYKDVFGILKRQNSKLKFVVPNKDDWELAGIVCDKLQIFHKVTEIFSGRKYPTANLFFRQVCEMKLALTSWLSSDTKIIRDMAMKMIEKFDKYWKSINGLLAIAAILDPRNKLECVEFYFNDIYGDMADFEVERVKGLLYDLMVEYQNRATSSDDCASTESEDIVLGKRKSSPVVIDCDSAMDKWSQAKKTKKKKVNLRSELDHYLEEDALPESPHFDILKFWNIELKYPILQKIAADILSIPASTVASESAFSMGGRVVTLHRSRLHANTVEALMCMQNWLLGDYSGYAVNNARACASVLEDVDDMTTDGEIMDTDSADDGDDGNEDFMEASLF